MHILSPCCIEILRKFHIHLSVKVEKCYQECQGLGEGVSSNE